jgi:DNA invertase Pin-like site-specific DNA recombinase/DNA-binding winged helix-turn-helix (wHTH) protein
MTPETPSPAAEYVRMSTDEQPNSIVLQQETIARYAASHGYQVVATYADPGRSGIEIKHRTGLRQLILDVLSGAAVFRAILVYDVSRWGRFQDTDESAHYEFICRSMGVSVHYCAEQFVNDGGLANEVMKTVKRAMAAEYSRELATKVAGGMRWLVAHGFCVGSIPGYGFRRMLVSTDGHHKQILQFHEHKNIKSDRVILVPGPRHEVEGIRTIFSLAADEGRSPQSIADELNRRRIKFTGEAQWTEATVYRILKNEKYVGCHVWGKTASPFGKYVHKVPPQAWVRKPDAFFPLVSANQFARVQELMCERRTKPSKSNEFVFNRMREVLAREGKLTITLLAKYGYFNHRGYVKRFGSVMRAYQLIGYQPSAHAFASVDASNKLRRLRSELLLELKRLFPSQLRVLRLTSRRQREIVELDKSLRIAVHICRPAQAALSGEPRWLLSGQKNERDLPSLICTTDKSLSRLTGFYLVPEFGDLMIRSKVLNEGHPWLAAGKRLDSLSQFCNVAAEVASEWKKQEGTTIVGDVILTARTSTFTIAGRELTLPAVEAGLFRLLVQHRGSVVPRKALLDIAVLASRERISRSAHPREYFLRNHICILRRKLGAFGERIITVKLEGYMYDTKSPQPTRLDRFSPLLRMSPAENCSDQAASRRGKSSSQ